MWVSLKINRPFCSNVLVLKSRKPINLKVSPFLDTHPHETPQIQLTQYLYKIPLSSLSPESVCTQIPMTYVLNPLTSFVDPWDILGPFRM